MLDRRLALVATLALAGGCHRDLCGSFDGACLEVELSAPEGEVVLDGLAVTVTGGDVARPRYQAAPRDGEPFALPVRLALVFDHLAHAAHLEVTVEGTRRGQVERAGMTALDLAPGEHRQLGVVLRRTESADGGAPVDGATAVDGATGGDLGAVCPAGMVWIPAPTGGGYCIDAREVTVGEYQAFLATSPKVDLLPGKCPPAHVFEPSCHWPPAAGTEDNPINCVNWCDAFGYCRWAGKRLCGKIGGGSNAYADFADATKSEWFNACSAGGARVYPYGDTFDGSRCNGYDFSASHHPRPTASMPGCEGGFPGLFGMSGNLGEWDDACDDYQCKVRGGTYLESSNQLTCARDSYLNHWWDEEMIGFRCCR